VPLVIHRLQRVSSTQNEARRLVQTGIAGPGHVVVADEQSEGRGRFGRSWLSPAGGLYATFVVASHPLIPLISGVAVLRALARFGVDAHLKWPNDIVVDGGKLAGTLIETAASVALVGIGINLEEAPLETATSVRAAGGTARRGELIVAIWEEMAKAEASEDILPAYRERLATLGEEVGVVLESGEAIEGTAMDVDVDGRLLVRTATGTRVISSGECTHLRSVPG
jgi:BirA family biotin operon repressor/biotin-[acetyl-CoA-carboxylase] ligase